MLRSMLAESIHICAAWTGQAASGVGVDDTAWAERASSPQPRTVADKLHQVGTDHHSRGHEPRQTRPRSRRTPGVPRLGASSRLSPGRWRGGEARRCVAQWPVDSRRTVPADPLLIDLNGPLAVGMDLQEAWTGRDHVFTGILPNFIDQVFRAILVVEIDNEVALAVVSQFRNSGSASIDEHIVTPAAGRAIHLARGLEIRQDNRPCSVRLNFLSLGFFLFSCVQDRCPGVLANLVYKFSVSSRSESSWSTMKLESPSCVT